MTIPWRAWSYHYGVALGVAVLATLVRMWLDPLLKNRAPFTIYYAAIMFTAWYGGWGPSFVALIAGALAASYLFIEPRGSLLIYDLEHQVGLGLYLFVGIVVTFLSESLHAGRRRIEAARARLAAANSELQQEIAFRCSWATGSFVSRGPAPP
jgi:K+-sensing histidine kinase KdpD